MSGVIRVTITTFSIASSSAPAAQTIERDRSAEMDRMFHFCRNQALSTPALMLAITQAGKTINGLCECIASHFVAALPDDLVASAQRGKPAPQMGTLCVQMAQSCSQLPD
jgi:hypothetical protein